MLAGSAGGTTDTAEHTALLINAKVAERVLALGARTLWSLTKCNAIPSRRIGRAVRYDPAELRAWVHAGCPTSPNAAESIRASMGGRSA